MAQDPQIPSRHDLLKVRVGSISFFYFDQGIQNHWTASIQIDIIFLHCRFVSWFVWIPSVYCKFLGLGSSQTCHIG